MCKPASFILTKDNVFWSKTSDSHEDIITEHNLHADGVRGANIVRVEITPPNDDFTLPITEWVYKLDQDDTPKWYNRESAIERVIATLPDWVDSKIVLPYQVRDSVKDGDVILAVYGTVNDVYGGTVNWVYGGTVNKVSGGTVKEVSGGTVNWVYGNGTVCTYISLPDIKIVGKGVVIDRSGNTVIVRTADAQASGD